MLATLVVAPLRVRPMRMSGTVLSGTLGNDGEDLGDRCSGISEI
jgi:hypothetical protein